jgi:hypothetical protein
MLFLFVDFSIVAVWKHARESPSGSGTMAWDPISVRHPLLWIVLLAAFTFASSGSTADTPLVGNG